MVIGGTCLGELKRMKREKADKTKSGKELGFLLMTSEAGDGGCGGDIIIAGDD